MQSLPSSALPEAAHIIMNLPALAVTFLPALRLAIVIIVVVILFTIIM